MNRKLPFYVFAVTLVLIFSVAILVERSSSLPLDQPAAPEAIDVGLTQSDSPDPVLLGNRLTYLLVARSLGNQRAKSVVVTDTLPASVTFASVSTSKGVCRRTGNIIRCTLGNFNRNTTVRITIAVTPTVTGLITNTATAATPSNDSNLANNTAVVTTTVLEKTDLSLSKTSAPNPVYGGAPLAYTLVVTNNGPSTATNVQLTDTLPLNVALNAASPGCVPNTNVVICTIGTLASGSSRTLTLTVTPDAWVAGMIVNSAVVRGREADPVTANNSATAMTTVNAQADLAVRQASEPTPALLSRPLTYTITLTNYGPAPATGVAFTDTLPPGVTFDWASPGCGFASGKVTCSLGIVSGGAAVTTTIRVIPNALGVITNTAVASGNEFDPNTANNTSSANTTVVPAADLSIVKTALPNTVLRATPMIYTLVITNGGPSDATSVVMTDVLPASVTFGSIQPSQGTCSGTSSITCSLGSIASGTTASVTVAVTPTVIEAIINTAGVNSLVADPDPANNTALLRTAVNPVNLSVSKTASAKLITSGNRLTYTIVVTNYGPLPGSGVRLTDTLPSDVTLGSVTVSQGTCSGTAPLDCGFGALNVGGVATVTVVVTPTATGTLVNTAFVSADQPDPDLSDNLATATTAVNPIDLAISKTVTPGLVYPGNSLTYTLVITNHGPLTATSLIVTDTLPANVTLWSAPPACTQSAGVVTCSLGSMTSGTSRTVTLTVTPSVAAVGMITNTASVSADQPEATPVDNSAQAVAIVLSSADLRIDKTDGPDPVYAGDSVFYVLTIVNLGPSVATNVLVTDALPVGMVFSTAPAFCPLTGGSVLCAMGALPVGSIKSVLITASPNATASGLITNTASASAREYDPSLADNTAAANTTVIAVADLSVTKSSAPDPASANNILVYKVIAANSGPSNATGVILTDTLPAGVTFNAVSPGCTQAGGVVTCLLGTMTSGVSRTIAITVTPQASTSGTYIENTAEIASNVLDSNPANNSFILSTAIDPADLEIVKTSEPNPVSVGNALTYTLVVTNHGPLAATGISLLDLLPTDVTFNTAAIGCTEDSGSVTCNLNNLTPGASQAVTILVTPTVAGPIANTALVDANEPDNNPANNTATANTTVSTPADLAVLKTASPSPVLVGRTLTYTLVVTNNGPFDATGVTLSDTLPSSVAFQSASPSCTEGGGRVTCALGSLAAGANQAVTILVTPTVAGLIANTALVNANEPDNNPANNTATANTAAGTQIIDLAVLKTASPSPVLVGTTLTYTLVVTNTSLADATGVILSDTLPSSVAFKSVSAGCTEVSGRVTCALGSLTAGASQAVTILVTPTAAGLIANTALVNANEPDSNPTNNTATANTAAGTQLIDLAVLKTASPNPVLVGNTLTYTLVVTNTSPVGTTGVTLSDTLPSSVAFRSASAGCTAGGGRVTCALGSLAAGASQAVTILVTPTAAGLIANTALVNANDPDNNPANNTATANTTVSAPLDMAVLKTASPNPVFVRSTLTYTLVVTNNGPYDATGVTLSDMLPISVTFQSASAGCTEVSGRVTCALGSLTAGANRNITILGIPTSAGLITNIAQVKADEPDTNPANNTATVSTTIVPHRVLLPLIRH